MLDLLFGGDDSFDQGRKNAIANQRLYDAIKDPIYRDFVPELYKNETANYELIQEDPLVKAAQMQYLSRLSGLADTGLSEVDQAGFAKARDMGSQMARAGTQSALQNAQARGVGGSGLEFAMRQMASQGGAQRSQQAALEQAAESARQRAQYQMAYGGALNDQRSADFRAQSANKGIINQFNEMNTRNRMNTNNANVDARNEAFQYNEGLKDKRFQNQLGRADRQAGFNNQMADIGYKENARRNARRSQMAGLAGAAIGYGMGGGAAGAGLGYTVGAGMGSY